MIRTIFRFIGFCLFIAAIIFSVCYSTKVRAQVPSSPTYTGALTNKVYIPAVFSGKNYKITADRLGSGGDTVIVQPVDTFADGHAVIGQLTGAGTTNPVIDKNGYGLFEYTNDTGSPAGDSVQVKVGFSIPASLFAIPVVSFSGSTGTPGQYVRFAILDPQPDSFIVEIQDNIPAGATIAFTYLVKAK